MEAASGASAFTGASVAPMLPRAELMAFARAWTGAGVSGPVTTIERPGFAARSAAHSLTQAGSMEDSDFG